MGAAAPKPPLAIPPHSKLWSFLAFSREDHCRIPRGIAPHRCLSGIGLQPLGSQHDRDLHRRTW